MSAPVLHNKGPFVDAMNMILSRYAEIIDATYTPEKMPSVTKEAEGKFLQLKGYGKMMKNNEEKIVSMKSIIVRLDTIKKEIDKLNCQIDEKCLTYPGTNEPSTHINQDKYNEGISEWTSAFSRISAEMVSGDDIAKLDNITKQIIDEKDYIYNDLLKGPNGCENSNEYMKGPSGSPQTGLSWRIYDAKRPNLGLPILYDYNQFTKPGDSLPDPYNSGYENKMTREMWSGMTINSEKQAMLPGVQFENTKGRSPGSGGKWCGDGENYKPGTLVQDAGDKDGNNKSYILCMHDLFWVGI